MSTPTVLLTGVEPGAMAQTMVGLQFDLPHAVAVCHTIDPERQVLTRVVSDLTGVLEHEEVELEHACVSCALREDVVPTLVRLARDGRWGAIVAHLPVGAEATQVCAVLAYDGRAARSVHVAAVVTALAGSSVVEDLLGDDLLVERRLHSGPDDRRAVGEVACAMVERADVVVVTGSATDTALGLARTLARPDAGLVVGSELLDVSRLVTGRHLLSSADRWTHCQRTDDLAAPASPHVWQVDLRSDRPFHPDRLLAGLSRLGSGRHRSRGCFWLPSRPDTCVHWSGSGGQLSVGAGPAWGGRAPRCRIVLTGVGLPPAELEVAFEEMLLAPGEPYAAGPHDGFEPWLGALRGIA